MENYFIFIINLFTQNWLFRGMKGGNLSQIHRFVRVCTKKKIQTISLDAFEFGKIWIFSVFRKQKLNYKIKLLSLIKTIFLVFRRYGRRCAWSVQVRLWRKKVPMFELRGSMTITLQDQASSLNKRNE
jgi:hypothetical protein